MEIGETTTSGRWGMLEGVGLVRIRHLASGDVEVNEDLDDVSGTYLLSADEAASTLRPIVTSEQAEAFLAGLTEHSATNDDLEPSRRMIRYHEIFNRGTLDEQLQVLRTIYQHPRTDHPERKNQRRFEALLLPQLAIALDLTAKQLRHRIRQVTEPPSMPRSPDPDLELAGHRHLPVLPGLRPLGAFAVEKELTVGTAGTGLSIDAAGGVWLAYLTPYFDDPDEFDADDDPDEIVDVVVVHRSLVDETASLIDEALAEGGEIPIEAACMTIGDSAVANNERFVAAVAEVEQGIVNNQAVVVRLWGDGAGAAHVARRDGRAVLVRVDIL